MPIFVNKIASSTSSTEHTEISIVSVTERSESYIEIQKTYTQQFTLEKYDEAKLLYDKLTRGGGRRVFELKDFV